MMKINHQSCFVDTKYGFVSFSLLALSFVFFCFHGKDQRSLLKFLSMQDVGGNSVILLEACWVQASLYSVFFYCIEHLRLNVKRMP